MNVKSFHNDFTFIKIYLKYQVFTSVKIFACPSQSKIICFRQVMISHSREEKMAGKVVSPIRDKTKLEQIKNYTKINPRNHLLFIISINSGLRMTDILNLTISQLENRKIGDCIYIIENKTKKQNFFCYNKSIHKAFTTYQNHYNYPSSNYIFTSRKGKNQPLTLQAVNRLIKKWCYEVNLTQENYGIRTLRKTFGLMHRMNGVGIELLQKRFNHSSPKITEKYIGITNEEVKSICMNDI